jgi:hypothetical protein
LFQISSSKEYVPSLNIFVYLPPQQVMCDTEKEKNGSAHVVFEMDEDIGIGVVCRKAISIEPTLQRD